MIDFLKNYQKKCHIFYLKNTRNLTIFCSKKRDTLCIYKKQVLFRTPKRESEGPIPQKHNDAAIASIVYQAGKVLINYFSIKNKAKLQSLTTQQSYDFAESYSTKLKLESTIIPFDLFL